MLAASIGLLRSARLLQKTGREECPLWVVSGRGIRHVRFTLKSGHVQSGHRCLLSARSGRTCDCGLETALWIEKLGCAIIPVWT